MTEIQTLKKIRNKARAIKIKYQNLKRLKEIQTKEMFEELNPKVIFDTQHPMPRQENIEVCVQYL